MNRYVIRHKLTGKFLKGTGKHKTWVDTLAEADLYYKKLTGFWWDDNTMELVVAKIELEETA